MKKLLLLMLTVSMLLSCLASCGDDAQKNNGDVTAPPEDNQVKYDEC